MPASTPSAAPAAEFIVLKFGGTSVATRERWQRIAERIAERRAEGARVLVVVSALSGVTNALQALIDTACADGELAPAVEALIERHRAMASELGLDATPELDRWIERLQALAHATDRGVALEWQAEVLALGELMSSSLGVRWLRAVGLEVDWLDAREALRAAALPNQSPWACWLSANCEARPDPALQRTLAARAPVLITQGFIAADAQGRTVILGRGGSDTTAGYFGALLAARRVEIWTDVAGMFSANPRQVADARLLRRLDYEEAQEIATTGAKVLHPRCLSPLREARVPLWVKDTNRPELEGTAIGATPVDGAPSVKAISMRAGVTLVSMETVGMWQQVGFLADVFAAFKRHGLSVDLIGSAETNVTVSLDPSENLVTTDVLSALCAELEGFCRVRVITPCAAVTLVGRGMRALLHRLAPVLAEFGQQNVHLISQSSNDLNLTFVVDEAVAAPMLPRLHELLVRAEALRLDDAALFGPAFTALYREAEAAPPPAPWWAARRKALLEVAAEASPRYVYATDVVRERAQALRALRSVDRWFYALKANPHAGLLREIAAAGVDLECVSLPEIDAALASGITPERVLFTPNFAPRAEYEAAYARGVLVTVDAMHPLEHWPEVFRGRSAMLRIDPGHGAGHHDKVVTAGAGTKFGLPLAQLSAFAERARALSLRITGIHAHLGSGILEAAHFRSVYGELATLADRFPGCAQIDIGGGLGVPARPDERALDLKALDRALAEVKSAYPQYALWMEPGRYLVAEAGVLLARVTQLKRKGEMLFVGVDAGMNSLLRPALYGAYHPIVNLSRLAAPADTLCEIVGPICESSDVLARRRRLANPSEGDVLLIDHAGAYGHAMASRYNLREPAGEVLL